MDIYGWLQLVLLMGSLLLLTKPLGLHIVRVLHAEGRTPLSPLLAPLEQGLYRLFRVDPRREQDWKRYAVSVLMLSLVSCLATYAILRLQDRLPLNPQGLGPMSPDLAFNTAVSFTTNTNWQSYGGESTMSYFSQMVALTLHNFLSAAVGIGVAAALVRGIARSDSTTVGNFWVDLVRINLYLLLPASIVLALFLVSQGMIQNFKPYETARLTEPFTVSVPKKDAAGEPIQNAKGEPVMEDQKVETQSIVQGPMASQVAIKMLGTNGGGYVNANASHPYENPTPLSNFVQMLSFLAISSGLVYAFGQMVRNRSHGWAVWTVMVIVLLAGVLTIWVSESTGNPRLAAVGVDAADGNLEGKEVRFGLLNSAFFAAGTTATSCGAVNAMHDSLTPLGGLVCLVNIHFGEIIFGGVGSGLYGMITFVLVAVFLFGLMAGRTPEYLGKKIDSFDVKMCALAVLVTPMLILGFTAWASVSKWGTDGLNNTGPHGLGEMLYAYSSAAGNNGSAFAGLTTNTPWYNVTMGLAMLFGRFLVIVPVMALAGNLVRKKTAPVSAGTFPVTGGTFVFLLIGTIVIIGALTFFPVWSLGPVAEHFILHGSTKLY